MTANQHGTAALPRYGVADLNSSIGSLLLRGFPPLFLLEATVSRPQRKKGHLWLTLTDGEASIPGVVWASQLQKLRYLPEEGDGVTVVGKLNFWAARASLSVQVLDVRPALSAVLRRFERVRELLEPEGLFEPHRKRALPRWPRRIALLTSVPSSALADMLRTGRERWPATSLMVVPIPVQGTEEQRLLIALEQLASRVRSMGIDAIVLARGGGSREDLAMFDGEALARRLASFPVPVVSGLGHEDDTTIADLVADYRASTPTAAIVALLPDQSAARAWLKERYSQMHRLMVMQLQASRRHLESQRNELERLHPMNRLDHYRHLLNQQRRLLFALSPSHLLGRGFSLLLDQHGKVVRSVASVHPGERLTAQLADGRLRTDVREILANTDDPLEQRHL